MKRVRYYYEYLGEKIPNEKYFLLYLECENEHGELEYKLSKFCFDSDTRRIDSYGNIYCRKVDNKIIYNNKLYLCDRYNESKKSVKNQIMELLSIYSNFDCLEFHGKETTIINPLPQKENYFGWFKIKLSTDVTNPYGEINVYKDRTNYQLYHSSSFVDIVKEEEQYFLTDKNNPEYKIILESWIEENELKEFTIESFNDIDNSIKISINVDDILVEFIYFPYIDTLEIKKYLMYSKDEIKSVTKIKCNDYAIQTLFKEIDKEYKDNVFNLIDFGLDEYN